MKFLYYACAQNVPIETLIKSRDNPLKLQTLILVVFIDATMPLPELINGLLENVPCTNKTRKILLLIICVVFLKITTFLWRISILHPGYTNLLLETIMFRGPRAEENKNPNSHHCPCSPNRSQNKHPLINKQMTRLFNLRPLEPKLSFVWDVDILFRYFE